MHFINTTLQLCLVIRLVLSLRLQSHTHTTVCDLSRAWRGLVSFPSWTVVVAEREDIFTESDQMCIGLKPVTQWLRPDDARSSGVFLRDNKRSGHSDQTQSCWKKTGATKSEAGIMMLKHVKRPQSVEWVALSFSPLQHLPPHTHLSSCGYTVWKMHKYTHTHIYFAVMLLTQWYDNLCVLPPSLSLSHSFVMEWSFTAALKILPTQRSALRYSYTSPLLPIQSCRPLSITSRCRRCLLPLGVFSPFHVFSSFLPFLHFRVLRLLPLSSHSAPNVCGKYFIWRKSTVISLPAALCLFREFLCFSCSFF